jgi:potassium-transporting ATPase KdpC subunit
MLKQLKTAFILLILFTFLTGLIYPAIVTGFAQLLFPWQANGSFIQYKHQIVGSLLLGQSFTNANYFWGRPSATTPFPYNPENSSGSNMGPTNPTFLNTVKERVANLHKADPQNLQLIPVDLITASASGLDPDISPLAAFYQIPRIAKARGIRESDIQLLVHSLIKNRFWSLLGEPRVNVLQLNLALDNMRLRRSRYGAATIKSGQTVKASSGRRTP